MLDKDSTYSTTVATNINLASNIRYITLKRTYINKTIMRLVKRY